MIEILVAMLGFFIAFVFVVLLVIVIPASMLFIIKDENYETIDLNVVIQDDRDEEESD